MLKLRLVDEVAEQHNVLNFEAVSASDEFNIGEPTDANVS